MRHSEWECVASPTEEYCFHVIQGAMLPHTGRPLNLSLCFLEMCSLHQEVQKVSDFVLSPMCYLPSLPSGAVQQSVRETGSQFLRKQKCQKFLQGYNKNASRKKGVFKIYLFLSLFKYKILEHFNIVNILAFFFFFFKANMLSCLLA